MVIRIACGRPAPRCRRMAKKVALPVRLILIPKPRKDKSHTSTGTADGTASERKRRSVSARFNGFLPFCGYALVTTCLALPISARLRNVASRMGKSKLQQRLNHSRCSVMFRDVTCRNVSFDDLVGAGERRYELVIFTPSSRGIADLWLGSRLCSLDGYLIANRERHEVLSNFQRSVVGLPSLGDQII
jgi:hypothetical protein